MVLGFFAAAWLLAVAVAVAAPEVYANALKAPGAGSRAGVAIFIAGLTGFLLLLSVGVIRRWRWLYWLILIAFAAGILRVPATLLELSGVLPSSGPAWYELLQGAIGIVQLAIAIALWAGCRKAGPWGAF